jgi:hypothetical protein
MQASTQGLFYGVSSAHDIVLVVPLVLPLTIWLLGKVAQAAARRGFAPAQKLMRNYDSTPTLNRVVAFLLALSGGIHLALAAGHVGSGVGTVVLFCLDGATFIGLSWAAFEWRNWRAPTIALLSMTLLAYLVYLALGLESPDLVGSATYVLELVALGLVWVPSYPQHRPLRA